MKDKDAFNQPDGAAHSGPVSKPELEKLRARREAPTPVLEYSMGEPTSNRIRKIDAERVRRAHYVEGRLRRATGRAENDFAFAKLKHRARSDFDRER